MKISVLMWVLLIFSGRESTQRSTKESSSYNAAVVEYRPIVHKDDPKRTLNENALKFVQIIERAADADADIVVFPEFGLTSTNIPQKSKLHNWTTLVPEGDFFPCRDLANTTSEALKSIACSAEQRSIYVVINVIEREKCSETICPDYGYFYYSTNVVFDPHGKLITRYRRYNQPDNLPKFDRPKLQEISTFETNFGVKFGNVIGLDIMYEKLLTSLKSEKISNVVYTAAWKNVKPFETAIQIHSGWAYANNVNLLAAGLNECEKGYSGSGIHAGKRKTVIYAIGVVPGNKPLHESVLKNPNSSRISRRDIRGYHVHDEFRRSINDHTLNLTYKSLNEFKWKAIDKAGSTSETLTDGGLTCEFHVIVSNLSPSERYYFVAHDTVATDDDEKIMAKRICAIIQCNGATPLERCGDIKDSKTKFNSITINASYVDNERTFLMPNTLLTNPYLEPLKVTVFEDHEGHEGRTVKTISLLRPSPNLATFGIWGRNFATDKPSLSKPGSSNSLRSVWIIVGLLLFVSILV